ncbi:MAG: chloride channel protein [Lachnospiraceae bacterium]|nr:chloride channel protein [Lachnospiraceae bacterium]
MKEKIINTSKLLLFTALLGAVAGLLIWCFLKAVSFATGLLWEVLPKVTGSDLTVLIPCVLGGLLLGIIHKYSGDYPEELSVVMGRIKSEKWYDYHHMPALLACAFIPLILGSSVGPEAGLTGIIAALCYWVGDNVTYAKKNSAVFSQIGEAVTLGQLFHSPLFGILEVEEGEDDKVGDMPGGLSKGNKFLLYGVSTMAGFLTAGVMDRFFGAAMEGFPSFDKVTVTGPDHLMILIYLPAGLILYVLFESCEKLTAYIGGRLPVILKETICGAAIGIMGIALPVVMFSGEEQMADLMGTFTSYSPYFLMAAALIKILMTAFCINLGMKGGHFFPLIFACTLTGFALTGFVFADPASHAAFAAAAVTSTVLGAQLKKPLAVTLLLLLCFPVKAIPWIFLCAAVGKCVAGLSTKSK